MIVKINHNTPKYPTMEEIQAATEAIRSTWSNRETAKRRMGGVIKHVEPLD